MVVLSRTEGEAIRIGDEITVRITKVRGHVVKIGVEAPRHVRILRGELAPIVPPLRPLSEALALLPRLQLPFAGTIR